MKSESSSDKKWENKKEELLSEFDDLLNSIKSAKTKEKILWRQIYENAISDRQNAHLCFIDIYPHLKTKADAHVAFGGPITQYMTRMEKSNEQLLKLATLIQKALENQDEEGVDENLLLEELEKIRKDQDKGIH
jgi:hypothetical protein